jgi:hypothetical protein
MTGYVIYLSSYGTSIKTKPYAKSATKLNHPDILSKKSPLFFSHSFSKQKNLCPKKTTEPCGIPPHGSV